jgi:hypothetical protein
MALFMVPKGSTTVNVPSPEHPKTHPEYASNCEEALDLPLKDLIDRAAQAGWNTRTVIVALQSLAWNRAIAYEEDPDPEDKKCKITADAVLSHFALS